MPPYVTEHAVDRYIERILCAPKKSVDRSVIAEGIRQIKVIAFALDNGCASVTFSGVRFILNPSQRSVITCYKVEKLKGQRCRNIGRSTRRQSAFIRNHMLEEMDA